MNLYRLLFCRPWAFALLVLITLLVVLPRATEGFVNYPQQVDPTAKSSTSRDAGVSADAAAANDHYAAILMFIKEDPMRAKGFFTDVQKKFFNESCTVRSDMDLVNLVNFSDGVPFR